MPVIAKCRAREKAALNFVENDDPVVAKIAGGIVQHHRDDHWFHKSRAFNELNLKFSVELRELFGNERSMRPGLIGHIIVEMLLDAFLDKSYPGELDRFYQCVDQVDATTVESTVNQFATRPTSRLADAVERFKQLRFLYDYAHDEGVIYRINRVLERVKLNQVPDKMLDWLPSARVRVYQRAPELLHAYPIQIAQSFNGT